MCGRYTQTADLATLRRRFGFSSAPAEFKPRYNLAPSQDAPVVIEDGGRRLELFRWGLIPSWAKEAAIGHKMINARAETLMEKPSFKKPFQSRRCLVLADGFYEWRRTDAKTKVPMRIALRSRQPFAMAGLWETWKDPEGRDIRSFAIITTAANEALKAIHERIPVILRPESEGGWLDPGARTERLNELLLPFSGGELEAYEVSPLVNSPKNDSPACAEPR